MTLGRLVLRPGRRAQRTRRRLPCSSPDQLDGAALFDLHSYSGEATWQCPAAIEFDEQLAAHCTRLQDAIDRLRVQRPRPERGRRRPRTPGAP